MHPVLDAYLRFLRRAGLEFSIAPDLVHEDDFTGDLRPSTAKRHHVLSDGFQLVEALDASQSIGADHASLSVSTILERHAVELNGRRVVDVGCGSGFLALVAAHHGARASGTEIDPRALELAATNAAANDLQVDWLLSSLVDSIPTRPPIDCFVANLPHKPSDMDSSGELPLAQAGGEGGCALFEKAFPAMAARQTPGGRVVFFLHSLPDPRLLCGAAKLYDLVLESWKLRWLGVSEFETSRAFFRERAKSGRSHLHRDSARNLEALVCGVWVGTKKN
ncbi:MAG: 50S ribosomal protein L11 methyltransferase [Planctomycetota bacterium]